MDISNREKILLCILGILVIGGGYYNFGYIPLTQKVADAESHKDETENKYNTAMATISNMDNKKSDLKILKTRISDCSSAFYPAISQEHIVIELNQLLSQSGLNGGIKFEDEVTGAVESENKEKVKDEESSVQKLVDDYSKIDPDSKIKKSSNASDSKSEDAKVVGADKSSGDNSNGSGNSDSNANSDNKNENKVKYIKCSVNFSGTFENLNTFLKSLRENKRKIIVNSLSTTQDSADGVKGKLNLEIYSIPKLDNEIEKYMKWNSNGNYADSIDFSSDTLRNINENDDDKIDFVMSANPLSSDLPSVMMGKAKDDIRTTYVYADSNKEETVEFVLTQAGDRYYYKYKTSKGCYPKDYNGKGVEFIPALSTSISLNVFSDKRLNSDDEAGVKLKVKNDTDMLLNVNVIGDDNGNPRITVDGDSSGISVNAK